MLYLASLDADHFVSIRQISDALEISFHFLTKTFQKLTDAGLLISQRGPSGGVQLARPASQITPADVLVAIDGPELFTECVLGLPGCGDAQPCPIHERWAPVRARIEQMFRSISLAEMGAGYRSGDYRLRPIWNIEDRA